MELNHWYKGSELPDAECDCILIYKVTSSNVFNRHVNISQYKTVGKIFLNKPSIGEFGFCNCDNVIFPTPWIVCYMPIEFPKEAE